MSQSCAQWRGDIGAYLVGALDRPACDRVARHLAACAGCWVEYEELAPVRDWLSLLAVTATGAEPGSARPPAGQARARRWWPAACGALAAAAVVVAALVSPGPSDLTFRAADSATGVTAHAQLHGTPTGTQIDLTATGLPRHQRCVLLAITNRGTDIAGSWDTTYDGTARVTGTSAFPVGQLTGLLIESDSGALLVSITIHA